MSDDSYLRADLKPNHARKQLADQIASNWRSLAETLGYEQSHIRHALPSSTSDRECASELLSLLSANDVTLERLWEALQLVKNTSVAIQALFPPHVIKNSSICGARTASSTATAAATRAAVALAQAGRVASDARSTTVTTTTVVTLTPGGAQSGAACNSSSSMDVAKPAARSFGSFNSRSETDGAGDRFAVSVVQQLLPVSEALKRVAQQMCKLTRFRDHVLHIVRERMDQDMGPTAPEFQGAKDVEEYYWLLLVKLNHLAMACDTSAVVWLLAPSVPGAKRFAKKFKPNKPLYQVAQMYPELLEYITPRDRAGTGFGSAVARDDDSDGEDDDEDQDGDDTSARTGATRSGAAETPEQFVDRWVKSPEAVQWAVMSMALLQMAPVTFKRSCGVTTATPQVLAQLLVDNALELPGVDHARIAATLREQIGFQ